ncbi:MAG: acetyl-CoA carboxylase biotin carboxyl carrier protein [Desulfuromonas sp.]|nr:acetyl-CoA carboxylase biotin carboxyl carrier protein [Desulfuromonas sp.]
MDVKDLKVLIKMVTETDITEFEMENADEKIVIKRGPTGQIIQMAAPAAMAAPMAMPVMSSAAPAALTAAPAAVPAVDDKYETINSPIVGTFYRKSSPEAPPFVEVGSVVEKGQTVCLVEAMKLFNEIEADFKCKIVEALKADAAPVEFGEPLFKVERL